MSSDSHMSPVSCRVSPVSRRVSSDSHMSPVSRRMSPVGHRVSSDSLMSAPVGGVGEVTEQVLFAAGDSPLGHGRRQHSSLQRELLVKVGDVLHVVLSMKIAEDQITMTPFP